MTGPGPNDARTLLYYAAEAPAYAASGRIEPSRYLAAFLDRLPAGGRILELGCGGGRDAGAMLARGFEVDATDGTPEMAREAEARLGRPVRVLRFDALDAVDAYDAIWAHASLLHVPRPALPGVLARIHRALRPGGHHFASYKSGGEEGRDRFDRYFNYPTVEQLTGAYAAAGDWTMIDCRTENVAGYDGVEVPWLAVTLRKPG